MTHLTSSNYNDFLKEIEIFIENEHKSKFVCKYDFKNLEEIKLDLNIKIKKKQQIHGLIIRTNRKQNKGKLKNLF